MPYPALVTDKKEMLTYITKEEDFYNGKNNQFYEWEGFYRTQHKKLIANNVDASRTKNNITLIHENIK